MTILIRGVLALLLAAVAQAGTRDGQLVTVLDPGTPPGDMVRLIGFDQFGQPQFASPEMSAGPSLTFGPVPLDVVTITLEYAGLAGELQATFSTSVALDAPVTIVDPPTVDVNDPIVTSLAFMGCNRIGSGARSMNLPSTANVPNMIQDFTEIPDPALHSPTPTHLFFTGDLVVNQVPGTSTLASQLAGWKTVFASTPLRSSAVELVTVAGNHEMLVKVERNGMSVEIPNPPTGRVFTEAMAAFIPADNGPTQTPPNPDGVARDESMLSFSFRDGNRFFLLLNTETYIGDDTPQGVGIVPLPWIEHQLRRAQADPTIEHVFVFGHKPIFVEQAGTDDTIAPSQIEAFTSLLCDPTGVGEPTKVRGYFCAHAHYWQQTSLACPSSDDTLQQVINGNGGTTPSVDFFQPPNGFFGYSLLGITQSGAIVLEGWGRFLTTPDDAPIQAQSTLREHRTIFPRP